MSRFDIGDMFCSDMHCHELNRDMRDEFSIVPESRFQLDFDGAIELFNQISKNRHRSPHFGNKVGYIVSINEGYDNPENIRSALIIYYYDSAWWMCTVVNNTIRQSHPNYLQQADESNRSVHL